MKHLRLLLAAILIYSSLSAQRISVQPSTLDFRLGPSATHSQIVDVANFSNKRVAFQAYLADWLRDSTGGHQYFRADTLKRSCANWVRLSKNFFELDPGKATQIVVQMQSATDSNALKQMKWAMLFVETVTVKDSTDRKDKEVKANITGQIRIGIHIYQTPPTLNFKKAKVVSLKPLANEPGMYELKMRNTGAVMLICKAYLDLTDVATGKQFKTEPVEFPVFPEGMRKVKLAIPANVPTGKYSALALLDIGEDMPLEALERTIDIKAVAAEPPKK